MSSYLALAVVALVDVGFGAHYGLSSDIAPCPESAATSSHRIPVNRARIVVLVAVALPVLGRVYYALLDFLLFG